MVLVTLMPFDLVCWAVFLTSAGLAAASRERLGFWAGMPGLAAAAVVPALAAVPAWGLALVVLVLGAAARRARLGLAAAALVVMFALAAVVVVAMVLLALAGAAAVLLVLVAVLVALAAAGLASRLRLHIQQEARRKAGAKPGVSMCWLNCLMPYDSILNVTADVPARGKVQGEAPGALQDAGAPYNWTDSCHVTLDVYLLHARLTACSCGHLRCSSQH